MAKNSNTLKVLEFSQYKRFSDKERLKIKPVTLLVGKNSSGKSSITKLLPVIAKSMSGDLRRSVMQLDTDGVSLGVSYQSLCHNGNSTGLEFGVSYSNGVRISASLIANSKDEIEIFNYVVDCDGKSVKLKIDEDHTSYINIDNGEKYSTTDFSGLVNEKFLGDNGINADFSFNTDYIGPLRCEPERTTYYKGTELSDNVGPKGDNAYQLLCADERLTTIVSEWFEKNFDGCHLRVVQGGEKGAYMIQMNKPDNGSYWVNIADEGMGMSQILPIVVRCMHPVENSIVVIEQPELHLHPAAHESLAKLFATTSKTNKQSYIVETHSENILLGIREAVVDSNIDFNPEDVIIYFVDEDENVAFLTDITIDSDGMLSDWPEGVFNESYDILNKIIEKASKHKKS